MTRVLVTSGFSLRVSVTDRCDLRCAYCMPPEGIRRVPREEILSYEEIALFVRLLAARYPVSQVRVTGGEPLVRPQIENLVRLLAEAMVPDLALTTNGQQLRQKAAALKQAGLHRVNISLDSLRAETFHRLTRGGDLKKTLDGIHAALEAGLHPVKLNMVVLRGVNDDETAGLVRFALENGCQIRFLELMPIGESAADFAQLFVPSAETKRRIEEKFALEALPFEEESTSRNYVVKDSGGNTAIVGFISPYSEPFCIGCRRLRLTATGMLIGCLARPQGIPLAALLRNGLAGNLEELDLAIRSAMELKRRDHKFEQARQMVQIGG